MNAQRFVAPNSRAALALAKAAFGADALILSSRSVANGFEVVATSETELGELRIEVAGSGGVPATPARSEREPRPPLQVRAELQLPQLSANSSAGEDAETLAMSTLSFQDYVRERMLRKRRDALQPGTGSGAEQPGKADALGEVGKPVAAAGVEVPAPGRRASGSDANVHTGCATGFEAAMRLAPSPLAAQPTGDSAPATAVTAQMPATAVTAPVQATAATAQESAISPMAQAQARPETPPVSAVGAGVVASASETVGAGVAAAPSAVADLTDKLDKLQAMMEERLTSMAWLGQARQNPIESGLMLKLVRSGYSPTVARAVMERLPTQLGAAEAFRWTQEVLARNLKTSPQAGLLCDEGGLFALIGATGVGKTTTAAKLAAQCVQAYGASSIGLITLDSYRIAGYEQLRAYARMLGVVAHLAQDRSALEDLLELLANKRMVIIDTAGLGHKDPRIAELLELLDAPGIKKLLVLNAGAHGDTLDEVVQAYRHAGLHGTVLSKLDEAAKLGPALDTLIRHQLVLRGLGTGQRVPQDWQQPDAAALVRMTMASNGASAYDPRSAELPILFADTLPAQVTLEGCHV